MFLVVDFNGVGDVGGMGYLGSDGNVVRKVFMSNVFKIIFLFVFILILYLFL